ncbi:unnamed protein product [Mytilus coruscus]|uniref:DDE Tnp4 domain-containing protein n=1 Tax=Mytilus coruscus TaxID=42192 RepID=A0A6J8AA67_MYTCO|nr:unnamed protein product [Mytilus coruscus]
MPLSTTSCTHHDQITQTDTTTAEPSIQVTIPEIVIDDIASSDDEVLFYTGLPCYKAFKALFDTLIATGADRLNEDDDVMMQEKFNRKLQLIDEFFIGNDETSFRKYLIALKTLVTQNYSDCTEIFIETPSALENKSLTYSSYKSHNTFKALVGVSMTGAVVFLSNLLGGSASDVYITRNCGLLELFEEGDAVMVEKGFIHIQSDLKKKKELNCNVRHSCPLKGISFRNLKLNVQRGTICKNSCGKKNGTDQELLHLTRNITHQFEFKV